MKKQVATYILLVFLFCILESCEKDDVCLVETQSTPRLAFRSKIERI